MNLPLEKISKIPYGALTISIVGQNPKQAWKTNMWLLGKQTKLLDVVGKKHNKFNRNSRKS